MAKDILNQYGRDSSQPQAKPASCGGVTSAKPLPYAEPSLKSGVTSHRSPGLGGTNHGNAPGQGRH